VRAGKLKPVDFENPPVIETLLSVQFVPLPNLTLPYIGLFWREVRDRYKKSSRPCRR
jgi:hypothetical protein